MTAPIDFKDLKLNSPAGAEPMFYSWPLQSGTGADMHDNGIDIIETIRWVGEDMPAVKSTLEDIKLNEIDTTSYGEMSSLCDTYNRAIDAITALVSTITLNELPTNLNLIILLYYFRKRGHRYKNIGLINLRHAECYDMSFNWCIMQLLQNQKN